MTISSMQKKYNVQINKTNHVSKLHCLVTKFCTDKATKQFIRCFKLNQYRPKTKTSIWWQLLW